MAGSALARAYRSHRLLSGGLAGLLMVLLAAAFLLSARGPEDVCAEAVRALQAGDGQALVELADPEEVGRLHLTTDVIRSCLRELYAHGYPERHRISLQQRPWVDSVVYAVTVNHQGAEEKAPLAICVLDTPDKGWRLNLSALLYDSCVRQCNTVQEAVDRWNALRDRHGITGTRQTDGSYTSYAPRTAATGP